MFIQLMKDESGVTAVEYALIVSLVSAATVCSWMLLGGEVQGTFGTAGITMEQARNHREDGVIQDFNNTANTGNIHCCGNGYGYAYGGGYGYGYGEYGGYNDYRDENGE